MAKRCQECRDGRRGDHYRRKSVTRRGIAATGERVTIQQLGQAAGWRCALCGEHVDSALRDRHPMMASFDHILPIALGGTDAAANLQLAHLKCNVRRGARATSS